MYVPNVKPKASKSRDTATHLCPCGFALFITLFDAVMNGVESVCSGTAWYIVAVTIVIFNNLSNISSRN